MSGGDVVCSGWLRKSPPEKKLRRYVSALYILICCVVLNLLDRAPAFFFHPLTSPLRSNQPWTLFMCTVGGAVARMCRPRLVSISTSQLG